MKFRSILFLEKESNKKGDLFGRLMGDLFHTLGYDQPRLNIHKTGREIDLYTEHRLEKKIAIAECKAQIDPVGGDDINKFAGVVDAEKRKLKKDKLKRGYTIAAYFISLSGFRETALEQENEIGNDRLIMVRAEKVVDELVKGRVLVSLEYAISSVKSISSFILLKYADLLAHPNGWIWILYYSNNAGQSASHFILIHAEGTPLIKSIADDIVERDRIVGGALSALQSLNTQESSNVERQIKTKNRYFNYLKTELGEIQFEGLPTDKDAGSVKVKLEDIFIPLHLTEIESDKKSELHRESKKRLGIGDILSTKNRLAILARPGGGKSTLIKRLAIAYAFPERRLEINDNLPDKNWFPIFLRCRELGNKVTLSITEIINSIPLRAEINEPDDSFDTIVSTCLQDGNALLLIDGLDEIAEDKNRIAFVAQLRTFIARYPSINIIVSSREAGFRVVGGSLAAYCSHFRVSNLIESEIEELSIKWHRCIIDESENTLAEAKRISSSIIRDTRIKVLAENPLLLTTLLFVKRWAGYIPTKKTVLYQEMIKLLLVTWNVQGHERLDIEEAEPQLAFIAYWMTKNGRQTITEEELQQSLVESRKQMPEILGYTNISPAEFIKRVEFRSSLLIMSGHKRLESGTLTQVYEFLHLSFQEYLTAKAIVKRYIPIEEASKKTVDVLKPQIEKEAWKEVIPITAVLLERDTKDLIEHLITRAKSAAIKQKKDRTKEDRLAASLLGNCIANEIQIAPELLGNAFEWFAKNSYSIGDRSLIEIILANKFGKAFRDKVKESFFSVYDDPFVSPLGSTLGDIFQVDTGNKTTFPEVIKEIDNALLDDSSKETKCTAIFGLMSYSFDHRDAINLVPANTAPTVKNVFAQMLRLLATRDPHYHFAIPWAVTWSVAADLFPDEMRKGYVDTLVKFWLKNTEHNLRRTTSWALSKLLLPTYDPSAIIKLPKLKSLTLQFLRFPLNEFDKTAAIFLGKQIGVEIERAEALDFFKTEFETSGLKIRPQKGEAESNILLFARSYGLESELGKKQN